MSRDKRGMRPGAQALVEALEKAGAEIVFGYPGGNGVDIFDVMGGMDNAKGHASD